MHITSFHIDGFGILNDTGAANLGPGLTVFLGENEAGKSTCLDFLRTALTGYPDPRSKEAREHPSAPLRGGQAGGTVCVHSNAGFARLTRRPGMAPVLTDADGNPLDPALWEQWLAGVTRDVYRTVFGFGLGELQTFASLNAEGVRHALYGASFGVGLRPPSLIFKEIDARTEALFKPGGSKPAINTLLREWEALRRNIQVAEEESAHFDSLTLQQREDTATLSALRERAAQMEDERRDGERQLGVWRQWDTWRAAKLRLERLEDVPTFPQDGPARLYRAETALHEAKRAVYAQQERCENIHSRLVRLHVDTALREALPQLHSIAERKTSYRNALTTLPGQQAALQRAHADLVRLLATLGPGWDCERIRATDRSLFAREDMECQAAAMQTALADNAAAAHSLEKSRNAVGNAEHNVHMARAALNALPVPEAPLDQTGRDSLRRHLAQWEDAEQRLPDRSKALNAARITFTRACTPLRLRAHAQPAQALRRLVEVQATALALGASVHNTLGGALTASQALAKSQHAEEDAKGRLDRLRMQRRNIQGPSRAALDARAAAVRSLRQLYSLFTLEQGRLAENESRRATMRPPARSKSWFFMIMGIVLALTGVAMLFARVKLGLTFVDIGPQLSVPITLWTGYFVILAGVGFLGGGLPRQSPEAPRYNNEMEKLTELCQSSQMRVAELEGHIQEQCVVAEVTAADPITLDATELLLEREREHCVTDERLNIEILTLEAELAALREHSRKALQHNSEAEGIVQQARKRWHECLRDCMVEDIPAPEAVDTFFARVESARMAHESALALEAEVDALENQARQHQDALRALPPVEALCQADSTLDVRSAAQQVLLNCREADAAEEERRAATIATQGAELALAQAEIVRDDALAALQASAERQEAARSGWDTVLAALGLGTGLSPATVREALDCMERCLSAEAETARLEDTIARLLQERDALPNALRDLVTLADHMTAQGAQDDPLACLDSLLLMAQAAETAAHEYHMLTAQATQLDDDLRLMQAAQADADAQVHALLTMANAPDTETFLRLADIVAQRAELRQRMDDLEDILRLAAGDTPLDDFLDTFAGLDHDERERHVVALAVSLEAIQDEIQRVSTRLNACEARLHHMTGSEGATHLASLRQQEADLSESLRLHAHEWSRYALARELLRGAKQRFERERQPQVIRAASSLFATITGNKWSGLAASLDDNALRVFPPHGEAVSPDTLSRGAQEQLYLALRLAYIRNHAAHAAPLPVVLDDILVNFDPVRAQRAAKALLELTQGEQGHQLFFFTCHPHMAALLNTLTPNPSYTITDGIIKGHL